MKFLVKKKEVHYYYSDDERNLVNRFNLFVTKEEAAWRHLVAHTVQMPRWLSKVVVVAVIQRQTFACVNFSV